jgi:branched-chain amino acid transport system ATP-binding protein
MGFSDDFLRMNMLFSLKKITVFYDKTLALEKISLEVDKNSIITLIGANGAGKSTVLRTISGLTRVTDGEIWFKNERIENLPIHEIVKRGIIHVAEGGNIFPYLSVLENLKMGMYLRKGPETRKNLENVYNSFPILKERARQMAQTLSGGEKQMLAIARAMLAKPELLMLDEPSLGLSPIMCKEIGDIISDIHATGIPIILVEQNARLALKLSDKAYVLENGSIVIEDKTKNLLENEHVKKAYLGGQSI